MTIPGNDLLQEFENQGGPAAKLGIYLRRYVVPAIQSRGRPGQVLATPADKVGNVQLQSIASLVGSTNPKNSAYVGTGPSGNVVSAATPASGITQLTGDVAAGPGSGLIAAQVIGVNGAPVPTSKPVLASNSSGQIIASTAAFPSFADNETVSGSGTGWTLAHAPSPSASLQLFVLQFTGGPYSLLEAYSLTGSTLTTTASYGAGSLRAWYRY